MKINKICIALLSAFLFTMSSSILLAQDDEVERERTERNRRHFRMDKRKAFKKATNERMPIPDLTEEQKSAIKALRTEAKKQRLPLKNQLNEKRARLRTIATSSNVNMNELNKVADEIGSLRNQLMKQQLATHQKVRDLLTEEQRIHFDSRPMKSMRRGAGK